MYQAGHNYENRLQSHTKVNTVRTIAQERQLQKLLGVLNAFYIREIFTLGSNVIQNTYNFSLA